MPVPVELQMPIFLKLITYDRAFERDTDSDINIVIVHEAGDEKSQACGAEIAAYLRDNAGKTIGGRAFTYALFALQTAEGFEHYVSKVEIDIVYVAPLKAALLGPFLHQCREHMHHHRGIA